MLVHFILLFAGLLAISKYKKKSCLIIAFFIIGLFAVLRYNYGSDYYSYNRWFEHIKSGGESPYKNEIGFTILNQISPSFQVLIAITSIFFLIVVFKLLSDNLSPFFAGLGLIIFLINPYLFLMNLSAIRQCIALCIFIVSLKFAYERKFLMYCTFVLFATLFHSTAILLLPVYFIAHGKKLTKIDVIIILVVFYVLMVENGLVEKIVDLGLGFFNNNTYYHYIDSGMGNSLRATILTGVSFVYVLLNLTKLRDRHLMYGKLYLIGLAFGMLAYQFAMFTRLQMYFDIFSIVTLPGIINYYYYSDESKVAKIINMFVFPITILLIYFLRYISFFVTPRWESFTVYHTIFEKIIEVF